jgi:hypothetical protein
MVNFEDFSLGYLAPTAGPQRTMIHDGEHKWFWMDYNQTLNMYEFYTAIRTEHINIDTAVNIKILSF